MSTPRLVEDFYEGIWNDGNLDAAAELLTPEFSLRGSLGNEMRGREAFQNYVRTVRAALADYQCEILSCVAEGNQAFAKMCFSAVTWWHFKVTNRRGRSCNGWEQRCSGSRIR